VAAGTPAAAPSERPFGLRVSEPARVDLPGAQSEGYGSKDGESGRSITNRAVPTSEPLPHCDSARKDKQTRLTPLFLSASRARVSVLQAAGRPRARRYV
jgi:hypothetical protein